MTVTESGSTLRKLAAVQTQASPCVSVHEVLPEIIVGQKPGFSWEMGLAVLTFVVRMASSSSASQDAANEAVKVPYVASSILERIWVDRSRTVAFRGWWDDTVDVIVVVGEILFLASLLLFTTSTLPENLAVCMQNMVPASIRHLFERVPLLDHNAVFYLVFQDIPE